MTKVLTKRVRKFVKVRHVDMCEGSDTLNMTISSTIRPINDTTLPTTLSSMDHNESDYLFWHVIFWVSPHFQAFVVSTSIILFAVPVSYLTGIFSTLKHIVNFRNLYYQKTAEITIHIGETS